MKKTGYVELTVRIHPRVNTLDYILRATYRALWTEFNLTMDSDLEVEANESAGLSYDENTPTMISRLKEATPRQDTHDS